MRYFMVGLGGIIGACLRFFITSSIGGNQSWRATLMANAAGSFAIGLAAEFFAGRGPLPDMWRLFLVTGILGSFTTFSAFILDTGRLIERGAAFKAAGYVSASVLLGLAGYFAALLLMRFILASKLQ